MLRPPFSRFPRQNSAWSRPRDGREDSTPEFFNLLCRFQGRRGIDIADHYPGSFLGQTEGPRPGRSPAQTRSTAWPLESLPASYPRLFSFHGKETFSPPRHRGSQSFRRKFQSQAPNSNNPQKTTYQNSNQSTELFGNWIWEFIWSRPIAGLGLEFGILHFVISVSSVSLW